MVNNFFFYEYPNFSKSIRVWIYTNDLWDFILTRCLKDKFKDNSLDVFIFIFKLRLKFYFGNMHNLLLR